MEQTTNTTPTTPITPNPIKTTPEASKTHKNKNQLLVISLIICAILALAGIGFGIYGVIASNHYSSEVNDLKSMIAEKDKTIANLKNPENPENPETPDEPKNPEEPQANSYTTFADNLAKNHIPSVFGYYYHYTGSDNVRNAVWVNIDQNCHLTITDLDNNNQTIAEADNIISAYFVQVGNGSVPYFYMIHKDGTVSRINISEDANHALEKLDGYTNIVAVSGSSDLLAYLIDINGNIYKTY